MANCGGGWKAVAAALLVLASGSLNAALADDATAPAAPLDLAPSAPAGAGVDSAPTAALKPQTPATSSPHSVSKLDLSPPAGFLPGLPPEAPPLTVDPSSARGEGGAASKSPMANAAPNVDPTPEIAPAPAAEPSPAVATPAAASPMPSALPAAAPAEAAPLSPAEALANEIHAALDRLQANPQRHPIGAGDWGAARAAIAAVYAERGYAPLWVDSGHWSARAKSALRRLAKADEDGLDLAATPAPLADWSDPALGAQALAEVELSAAVVAYALQAGGARINPRAFSKDVSAKPEVADPGAALKAAASAEDPDAALAAFNPPQEGYRALRAVLAAARGGAPTPVARFAPGPVLSLGMSDPRVPLIRARFGLGARGDGEPVYDIRVASAVAAFQRVHGLPPNGALTVATAAALDGGPGAGGSHVRRDRLILANMEMWRWQPREMGGTRVEVNVPDFSLKLVDGDAIVLRTRVIVGKPDTPTPIFSNSIKYMLFNPAWRVPQSIIKKEMAPRYAADPSYFERHGYKVSYVGNQLEVVQPPGEANALGRMLFLFPNEHAVYLHDTPQRSLFSAGYRALSHGCVRVEDPARLAVAVLGGAGRGWSEARVRSLLGDKERTIGLPAAIPIHLEYFTEFVDDGGTLRERQDVYGLTAKVASALMNLQRD